MLYKIAKHRQKKNDKNSIMLIRVDGTSKIIILKMVVKSWNWQNILCD